MLVVISETSPRADIEQAMTALRTKQRKACQRRDRDEIDQDLNDLLDLWANA